MNTEQPFNGLLTIIFSYWRFGVRSSQRWSPRGRLWSRGHILKSLALDSKPQVLKNCLVLGSRTARFLNRWNFVGKRQKSCAKSAKTFFLVSSSRDCLKKKILKIFFFFEIAWKKILKTFFFWWTLASVSLALRGSVLGLGLEIFLCPWPWLRALCGNTVNSVCCNYFFF